MSQACYRELRSYKYELVQPYVHDTGIKDHYIATKYLRLETDGKLEISRDYAWDGPSGPTIDTLNFMRGSLVHDALYQLIRLEKLPYSCKDRADALLKEICLEDGMSKLRAWYVHLAVKYFGGSACKPGTDKPDEIVCAPGNAKQVVTASAAGN